MRLGKARDTLDDYSARADERYRQFLKLQACFAASRYRRVAALRNARAGTPDEVANVAALLMSNRAMNNREALKVLIEP